MKLLRDFLIQRNIRNRKAPSKRIEPDLGRLKTVLLLIDSNRVSHAEIVKSRKVFEDLGIQTSCITFSKEKQDTAQKILQLDQKSFFMGVQLKKEWISAKELGQDYDMILCYNPQSVALIHLIMSQLRGNLRIGSEMQHKELYDIIVEIEREKNMHRFAQQSLLLLQNLNKYELVR